MKDPELSRKLSQIHFLISRSESFSEEDFEIRSHWAKYICILSAGLLENALHKIFSNYCSKRAHPHVANFASKALDRIKNPRADMFLDVAVSFNENWKIALEAFIEDNGRKEAINSIMGIRHLIAHGKDTNISLSQLKNYLDKSVQVMEFIEVQCGI